MSGEAGRIHVGGFGGENQGDVPFGELGEVSVEGAGIFGEIFLRGKLRGVHENGDDGVVALLLAALDEAEMAGVQCAHGGNQADAFAAGLLGADDALDLSGVCDDGGWFQSGGRGHG